MTPREWHRRIMAEVNKMVRKLTPGAKAAGIWDAEEVVAKIRSVDNGVRDALGLPEADEDDGTSPAVDTSDHNMTAYYEDLMEDIYELGEMLVPGATTSGKWVPGEVEDMFSAISAPLGEALGLEFDIHDRPRLRSGG